MRIRERLETTRRVAIGRVSAPLFPLLVGSRLRTRRLGVYSQDREGVTLYDPQFSFFTLTMACLVIAWLV
jgi:hypothetical protein